MSLEKLIIDILNIKSDKIEKINSIDKSDDSLEIRVRLKQSIVTCPICNGTVTIHGYYKRKLTHSTLMNRKCFIIYDQRRVYCSNCNKTFHEDNPFSYGKENITIETKINVLEDLKYPNITYTLAAKRNNISTTKAMAIFDRHVHIERKPLPEVLSMDEHYFPSSSYDSLYMCILMNFNDGTIIDVLPDRKKHYLEHYFSKIKTLTFNSQNQTSELDNVKYISIDLYDNYRIIAKKYFPKAKICADSFHVLKHLTEAFKKVRLKCLRQTEDENIQYLLTKFKFIFNYGTRLNNEGKYNKRFKRYLNYQDIATLLFERFPELKKAYELKNEYIRFNCNSNIQRARQELSELIKKFADSNINEYMEFYNLLINWYEEIINSFNVYNDSRINNSYIESRNSSIEKLILNANGFTNFKRTRNRILYCLNKDDKYKI